MVPGNTHISEMLHVGVESKSLCERWKSGNKKKVKTKLMLFPGSGNWVYSGGVQ